MTDFSKPPLRTPILFSNTWSWGHSELFPEVLKNPLSEVNVTCPQRPGGNTQGTSLWANPYRTQGSQPVQLLGEPLLPPPAPPCPGDVVSEATRGKGETEACTGAGGGSPKVADSLSMCRMRPQGKQGPRWCSVRLQAAMEINYDAVYISRSGQKGSYCPACGL